MTDNGNPSLEETAAKVAKTLEEHAARVAIDLEAQGADFRVTMEALETLRGSLISQKNKIRVMVAVGTLIFLLFGLLGWQNHQNGFNLRSTVTDQRQLVARQQAVAAAAQRESQVIAHGQCLRLDDGRLRFRQILGDEIVLIFGTTLPGATPLSPDQVAALDRLRKSLTDRATLVLPTVDCDKAAPLPPPPLTPTELAGLLIAPPIPKPLTPP